MPRPAAGGLPDVPPVGALARHYPDTGEPLSCVRVTQGLLNRGYRLTTTRGTYFLKHHLDGDREAIARQHRAVERLGRLGVPVAPPLYGPGGTVAVVGEGCYALHPWVEGRHRDGGQLTRHACRRLGELLGRVHVCLERVMSDRMAPSRPNAGYDSRDPAATFAEIDQLLAHARRGSPGDPFDELAEHRLVERRNLLERHAARRPPPGAEPVAGWVHGDFHPLNVLYRGFRPAAIVDWDRLGIEPRAEEVVRAGAIFFVRPSGELELGKVREYARAYRRASGADAGELAAAVHRLWWERLNDFWILRWHYLRNDRRADPQFAAVSALAVWWTEQYARVRDAFTV